MARREDGAHPPAGAAHGHHGATKPDGLLPENPPGGGSFARGRRWLVPYSPLRGCSELAALATTKIPRRRPPANFKTGSKEPSVGALGVLKSTRGEMQKCQRTVKTSQEGSNENQPL